MPTTEFFDRYPPFPNEIPVIDLECLNLTKLLADDAAESAKLFQAAQDTGFFLINLQGCEEGESMLRHAEKAFDLSRQIHDLEYEELKKYAFKPPASLYG